MQIENFFSSLSDRLYKENNLSDITWAICQADNEFQQLFLNYCFNEAFDSHPITLCREFTSESSRPDFYFKYNDIEHIIEVKIYDQNHHFKQYNKSFPDSKKAFIANYEHKPVGGYVVTDWEGFYKVIESYLQKTQNENLLLSGYLQYLENVINYVRINKMNLENINSIFDFNESIKKVINTFEPEKCKVYAPLKSHEQSFSGQYFEFVLNKKTSVYPWFGLHFEDKGIWIAFEEKWCKSVLQSLKKIKKGKYHDNPSIESDGVWFGLKDDLFSKFSLGDTKLEQQKEILKDFFKEVMSHVN